MTPEERDAMIARLNTLDFQITQIGNSERYRVRGAGNHSAADIELLFAGIRGGFRLGAQRLRDLGHMQAAAALEVESNWPPGTIDS